MLSLLENVYSGQHLDIADYIVFIFGLSEEDIYSLTKLIPLHLIDEIY